MLLYFRFRLFKSKTTSKSLDWWTPIHMVVLEEVYIVWDWVNVVWFPPSNGSLRKAHFHDLCNNYLTLQYWLTKFSQHSINWSENTLFYRNTDTRSIGHFGRRSVKPCIYVKLDPTLFKPFSKRFRNIRK